jgi:AcrR family transcriptional regulator
MSSCDQLHTMTVNRRTHRNGLSAPHSSRPARRSQAERRSETRRALLDAALEQLEAGIGFDSLSLRRVTREAGVVPAAFYRHFAGMDELGLALVEESVHTLREMLREAREDEARRADPDHLIARSVAILVDHVHRHRRHFAFITHARASGNVVLRHAIRAETRLFASELATDLARFPVLREWTTGDLQMLAGMFVDTMIATIDAILEASNWTTGPDALTPERQAQIAKLAEKQMRLIALAIPHWRSRP